MAFNTAFWPMSEENMKYSNRPTADATIKKTCRSQPAMRLPHLPAAWIYFAITCGLIFPAADSFALSSDSKQPMYVESDSVVYDENKGETVYVGNVKASQGSLEVTGDKMIINQEKGKADQMIIYGSPARLKQTPDGGGPDNHGVGKRADYFPESGILILNVDAMTWEGPDPSTSEQTVKSDHIEYDTKNSIYKAGSSKSGSRRVHVKIVPKDAQTE
jgi:lipopolysaccharide export system protein LptA